MGFSLQSGYTLPGGDELLTHARIAHSGNWFTGGTVTASGTATDYDEDAPLTSLTYEKWQPDSLAASWEYDHGSAVEADYCVIGAHNCGTKGNEVSVEYYNGSIWVEIGAVTPTDNMPIWFMFEPTTAQRWRVVLSSAGSAPSIGIIKFGMALQMPRPIYGGHSPLHLARQTTLRANISETGEFLGKTKLRTQNVSTFDWQNITAGWVRTNWTVLQEAVETEPFFIVWRPSSFSEVALCQTDSIDPPSNMGVRDLMSVSLSVRAQGYD